MERLGPVVFTDQFSSITISALALRLIMSKGDSDKPEPDFVVVTASIA